MSEIILHAFSYQTRQEVVVTDFKTKGLRYFSYILDKILTEKDFITEGTEKDPTTLDPKRIGRIGKTLKQDFINRIDSIKARAKNNPGCTINNCQWCKSCFNKVCDAVNLQQHKIL